ncbi:hypothetical protein [Teredinibacter sp. KSP-S5-2]|uniref:hypothetical protein n=1 Tax=Teredinibacter sp. KSP-S5-2 TaxID=3034506 RepID=UPI00293442BD|nr:hypothetical protein [Teredinibacter sp. KSP-S5-2]WNO10609.1 hypothetical protein P5V12_05420 [Teredinibacter sp. KSP-S5-2]
MRKMDITVSEILEAHAEGLFLKSEVVSRLITASVYFEPEEIINQISGDLINEIRERVKTPPKTANEIYHLGGKNYSAKVSSEEIKALEELEKVVSFAGYWRMHVYFKHA